MQRVGNTGSFKAVIKVSRTDNVFPSTLVLPPHKSWVERINFFKSVELYLSFRNSDKREHDNSFQLPSIYYYQAPFLSSKRARGNQRDSDITLIKRNNMSHASNCICLRATTANGHDPQIFRFAMQPWTKRN